MAAGRKRNRGCVPYLEGEGVFLKPLVNIECKKDSCHDSCTSPFERLFVHHTLASARRFAKFKNFDDLVPKDELDLILTTTFDESSEIFPEKVDTYFQPETVGIATWRRLRNTRDLTPDREEQASILSHQDDDNSDDVKTGPRGRRKVVIPYRYNFAHKVLIGGVTEKTHPCSVKLMNSSHHSPQTNAGYSRQPSDGNFYQY